jgi:hypothetical protein
LAWPARSDNRKAARAEAEEAMRRYNLNEFSDSLIKFKSAYLHYPDPVFLFNIAQCERQLGDTGEALKFYRNYLRELPDAPNREEVRELVAALERGATAPISGVWNTTWHNVFGEQGQALLVLLANDEHSFAGAHGSDPLVDGKREGDRLTWSESEKCKTWRYWLDVTGRHGSGGYHVDDRCGAAPRQYDGTLVAEAAGPLRARGAKRSGVYRGTYENSLGDKGGTLLALVDGGDAIDGSWDGLRLATVKPAEASLRFEATAGEAACRRYSVSLNWSSDREGEGTYQARTRCAGAAASSYSGRFDLRR